MGDGRFDILELLGAGAFAVVCAAEDRDTGRVVALKVLRGRVRDDPDAVRRLCDEGRILARLDHPNIARGIEVLEYAASPVVVSELVEGVSLDPVVQEVGPLPEDIAAAIGLRVARALAFAWEAPDEDGRPMRIVHRDLKPNNVLLSPTGGVKVIDFGIAKGEFADRRAKSLFAVQGTAGYEAPERRRDGSDGQPVDVYGLGALLWTLRTGETPMVPVSPRAREAYLDRNCPAGPLGDLVREMLALRARDRPDMADVAARLAPLAASEDALRAFAARTVPPLLGGGRFRGAVSAEGWEDLRFLERDEPTEDVVLDPATVDAQLAELVRREGWERDVVPIESMLSRVERFTPDALVEVLERATVPWYAPWRRAARAGEVEAALVLLCDRADERVLAHAARLEGHADERVRAAARFLLTQHATR